MPPNSEIDKLERRWKENPKGTVFAPYAEVLRKHGNLELARDILRQGLEIHPDHIPGNIVLGRCCLDLLEEGSAEAAFTHVLDLDPENVIALKVLGDVTERQGRLLEAAGWLQRLISVDPSNDEARDQFARVNAARESASATITTPMATPGRAGAEKAETHFVIQPATPASLELPVAEVGQGVIGEEHPAAKEQATDAVVEAVLGQFEPSRRPPPPPAPSLAEALGSGPETTVPVMRAVRPAPAPVAGLEPAEVGQVSVPAAPLEGIEPDQVFEPPPQTLETGRAEIGLEETFEDLQLRASGGSEFQTPDASDELKGLAPGPTKYQQPDAAAELTVPESTGGQVPDAAMELASAFEELDLAEPADEAALSELPADERPAVTTGFAAISAMPTEEWSAEGAATPGGGDEGSDEPGADLRLIFPDQASQPEPQKMRRISEEIATARQATDPPVGEPSLVVTESMAELYAQQGHVADALNVYRVLLARTPNDPRLADRVRELEADLASGSRRLSYVAVETGGESGESFFRALAQARPGGGEPAEAESQPEGAAPTRPARDPLSLSAIFGEETGSGQAVRPDGRTPDSFSFDQFFGGAEGSPHTTGPRQAMPPDEDLDQFQNWLKSLRR